MRFLESLAPLWGTAKSIIPLTAILAFIQVVILKRPINDVKQMLTGFVFAVLGLHLFLKGTTMTLLPLGDSVGRNLYVLDKKWAIVIIAFIIGYFGTLVEPGLRALAMEVEELSVGVISQNMLVHGVAIGFGLGMVIGMLKIILNISYVKIIVPLLLLVLVLVYFTPEPFVSIAVDSASATTGPVNIPLNMALAVGLASIIEGADPLLSGFGVVGLTSMGAMITVLILGIMTKF